MALDPVVKGAVVQGTLLLASVLTSVTVTLLIFSGQQEIIHVDIEKRLVKLEALAGNLPAVYTVIPRTELLERRTDRIDDRYFAIGERVTVLEVNQRAVMKELKQ